MITSVDFFSLEEARRMRPRRDTLLISILDVGERTRHRAPNFAGWRSVLLLDFEDTSEEIKGATPGSWPDEPTPEQHASFSQDQGEKIPTLSDARRIVDFVMGYHALPERLELTIHCFAGASRSAAICAWTCGRLGARRPDEERSTTKNANRRLLRLLDKALVQHHAEWAQDQDESQVAPSRRLSP